MLPKLFLTLLLHAPMDEKPIDFMQHASLNLVALHQNYLTHMDGPRSHYIPCSSSYMKEAIKKHGFFYGSLLGLDRLLRENSDRFCYNQVEIDHDTWIKYDPVP